MYEYTNVGSIYPGENKVLAHGDKIELEILEDGTVIASNVEELVKSAVTND